MIIIPVSRQSIRPDRRMILPAREGVPMSVARCCIPTLARLLFCCAAMALFGAGKVEAAAADCTVYAHARQLTHVADWVVERPAPVNAADPDQIVVHVAASPPTAGGFSCLMIQCAGGSTSIWLETSKRTAVPRRRGVVSYSVDDRPSADQPFLLSSDGRSLGLWTNTDALQFAGSLVGGQHLSVTMKPAAGPSLSATFNIRDIDSAIAPVRAACRREP
jgi:hypothetical protein